MANIGSGPNGYTLIGTGTGKSANFVAIGTNSALTAHGVVISQNNSAFVSTAVGTAGQILTSNGPGLDPTFQSLTASIETITGNSGGPEIPLAGNFNILGAGSIETVGSSNTETIQLTGLTNHNVLLGSGTATITNLAPSATLGIALVSQGAAADPAFSTVVVSGGGTGQVSLTNHGVVIGQGTSAVAVTSAGTATHVLTSNGASSDPTFQALPNFASTFTGNSGGAQSPLSGNFNILGSGSITTVGSANTETIQLTGLTNHNILLGAGTSTITNLAPSATSGIPLISQGAASDPAFGTATVPGGGTGQVTLTNHGVLLGQGTSAIVATSAGTATQVLTSNGASADPTFQDLPNFASTFTGNSGGAQSPLAGNFNILGTGSITIAGSANTETVQLTGLTNHSVLVGAGTATITNLAPSATSGVPLISQGASSDPVFGTATVPGGGTGQVTLLSHGVLVGNGTSGIGAISVGTTGTLLVGTTSSAPSFASSANGNFTFTNSTAATPRTLTISNTDTTSTSSNAVVDAVVSSTTGGDPFFRSVVGSSRSYSMGIDASSTNVLWSLKTAANASSTPSLGTTLIEVQPAGSILMPLQATVTAFLTTNITNATGDGTQIAPVIFDTIEYQQQTGLYSTSTGFFTTPVAGTYLIAYTVTLSGLTVLDTAAEINVRINGSSYNRSVFNPGTLLDTSGNYTFSQSLVVHVGASLPIGITVTVSGSTKTVGILGEFFGKFSTLNITLLC